MSAADTTLKRLKAYLEGSIETKEREEIILRGEISALKSTLSTLRTFKEHDEKTEGA